MERLFVTVAVDNDNNNVYLKIAHRTRDAANEFLSQLKLDQPEFDYYIDEVFVVEHSL